MAKEHPGELGDVITELQRRETFIANYLLLNLYTAGASHFADEAATLICNESWRFECGFSDSSHWVAVQMIQAVVEHCSPENRAKLEEVILSYSPEYERGTAGHGSVGRARFALLSAIPASHRSDKAQAKFRELERKFVKPIEPPRGIHVGWVGSPIAQTAAEKMTDQQWLKAIAKYQSEDRPNRWREPQKGAARELAGTLREFVRNEPERFARLSLNFPPGTNPVYIERTLDGLKGTSAPTEVKLAVCRKAYAESREQSGAAIADLLGTIKEPLPDDAVQMLDWLATEHPDPEKELWRVDAWAGKPYYGGDIHNHGINTARGRAAEAISNLILCDARYIKRFRSTLDRLVNDQSLAVRSCVASIVLAVARHDVPLALQLFQRLLLTDEHLLQTPYVERFIYYNLREHFEELRPIVERMLRSTIPEVSRAGARLASLAALHHDSAANLVGEAMSGTAAQRRGVAEVAAANIGHAECRTWCEPRLLQLFSNADAKVRGEAASCFRHLEKEPLEAYEDLIMAFCESAAYQEDSFSILHMLEDSVHRLPGITCIVCEKFLDRFSDEAKDMRTHRAGDSHTVVKLIFRTYHQHQQDDWAGRCLDLIDRMCLEGIHEVKSGLEEFER
jgi:transcription initiation factor TFIIIB Brf1 subunit/transcription initiation factor TFIIB